MKRWIVPKVSKDLIKELAEQCDVSEFLALIAAARGYTDPLELDAFLSCDEPLDSPYSLTDMDNAVFPEAVGPAIHIKFCMIGHLRLIIA